MNFLDYFGGPDVDKEDVKNPNTIVVDENGDVYQDGKLIKKGEDVDNVKAKDKKEESKIEDKDKTVLDSLPDISTNANTVVFDDYMKNKLLGKQLKDDMLAEKERVSNLSFVGKMLETLKTDANARQKFFDQMGSIGAEISRPTQPGEARSFVRDLIVGSKKGEATSLNKAISGAKVAADMAKAAKDANPVQFFTTTMKNIYDEAARTYKPGSPEYNEFIRERLRIANIGSGAKALFESLETERAQLNSPAALQDPEIKKQIENNIDIINQQIRELLGMADTGGTTESATSIYDATTN
jgi:hypothetical protein|tara:strand:+ start:663 stop:1556 length:894 start_codon:yes stop_codon:yes gene_type:complete